MSCTQSKPVAVNAKDELAGSLKDANLEGFFFETREDDAQEIAAFTNGIVSEPIKVDGDITLVLRYTRVKDKTTNTTTIYRTEAVRKGDQLTLQVTDIASGTNLMTQTNEFAPPPAIAAGTTCGPPAFNSFDDCVCSMRAALLFEANRTCTTQFGAATCCINGTDSFSVHFFVMPTSFKCKFSIPTNFDDLVFFRE
jgi:hypothetical protein